MIREALQQAIAAARHNPAYSNYLAVRERVIDMLEEAQHHDSRASAYWEAELAGFDYMLDASPLVIQKLREHCYHITGLRSYDYRAHHHHRSAAFAAKLAALQAQDYHQLRVTESPVLGGFGHTIDGALYNIDTLKFYEALIALSKAGILAPLRDEGGDRLVVLEIGAGWGGFAFQFKKLCPNVTYVIVDLPETLLFSAVYLQSACPGAKVWVYGDTPTLDQLRDWQSLDFAFLPHFAIERIAFGRLDLVINMASFQEMTPDQVSHYARTAQNLGCRNLYSLNRDISPHNNHGRTVSSILSQYFALREVEVLDVPYTALSQKPLTRPVRSVLNGVARNLMRRPRQAGVHEYRHLVGMRRNTPVSIDQ
jgi:putative sugar O-methyltransferase